MSRMTPCGAPRNDLPAAAEPFVKCLGGKRKLLPTLLSRVPREFRVYSESFVGGGALFFELYRMGLVKRAILSDSNVHLVRAYWAVRDHVEALIDALDRMVAEYQSRPSVDDRKAYYLGIRALDPEALSPVEQAARYIFISRAGFNGIWRVNQRGTCNTPHGDGKDLTVRPENLRACSGALQCADIRHADFAEVMREAEEGWFVYCDPPYVPLSATSNFVGYCADGFSADDHARLRDAASAARARGVHVLLSNSSAPAVFELYQGWTIETVDAKRAVNCKGDGRKLVKEVLIS